MSRFSLYCLLLVVVAGAVVTVGYNHPRVARATETDEAGMAPQIARVPKYLQLHEGPTLTPAAAEARTSVE